MYTRIKVIYELIIFSIFIFFSINFTLCAENISAAPIVKIPEENKTALNVIHSLKIKSIMGRLNMLSYEREYTELELDQLRAEQIELLIQTANELTLTAENLPDIIADPDMSDEDQATFRAMANLLYLETLNLQQVYNAGHKQNLEPAYRRLHQTCNACHRLFRDW